MTLYDFLRVLIAVAVVACIAVAADYGIQSILAWRKRRKLRQSCSPHLDPKFPFHRQKYTRTPRTRKR